MKKTIIFILIVLLVMGNCVYTVYKMKNKDIKKDQNIIKTNNYNIDLIKIVNNINNDNYLISPYSIEIALNMVREGSDGSTLKELNKVLNDKVKPIKNDNVHIANAMFLKDKYQKDIEKSFINNLKNNYGADTLIDEFKTPKVINDWVNKNTKGMIPKILDKMDEQFILGLANAIAIDVKWDTPFECIATTKEEFTKNNGKRIDAQMMHQFYQYKGTSYFTTDSAKGIIIPYREDTNLEFVGILPNKDIDSYIKNLTSKELIDIDKNKKEASSKLHINLSLPRFTYDYNLSKFKEVLIELGIKEIFSPENANFNKIITKESLSKYGANNIYIDEAIHKTHIELNEEGTKAAAVTYFGFETSAALMPEEYETIEINFNKPFIYIIRDKTNHNILFFGVVNTPNKWNGTTCKKESLS